MIMKSIKFLEESFERKEKFEEEIRFKYCYNGNRVEKIDFGINEGNIRYFYEGMENFENCLVDEFKEKKSDFCNGKEFLEKINEFDKIVFVIISQMKRYFDLCKDYCKISLYVDLVEFDFSRSILIEGLYNYSDRDLSFCSKLEWEVLDCENELVEEKLEVIREEICELIGVEGNLEKEGEKDNYILNLNIKCDNEIGFFL